MTDHPITNQMLADKNATGHSIFGPSSAHRWMRCARSLIAGHLAGDRPTKFAAEGSVAHWLAEEWLTNGDPWKHLGSIQVKDGFEIEITEEMISYIEEYVAWVSTAEGDHFVEVKVDLSDYTPVPSFGTSDHIHCRPGHLIVTDLKYGKVWVDAKENEQGMAYGLGAFLEWDWLYDFQYITIRICQPRRDNFDEWTFDRTTMLAFAERYREASHKAWDPEAPYNPDPVACEYCPARQTCPALKAVMVEMAKASFDAFDEDGGMAVPASQALVVIESEIISTPQLPEYHHIPVEQLGKLYHWRPIFERWFRELYDYLLHQLELGVDVPGHKLGMGRAGNRKWTDEPSARKYLKSRGITDLDLYDSKFISPSKASELLRVSHGGSIKANDALLKSYVYQPPGKLTMIPKGDVRPEIASAVSAFDDDI